MNADESECSGGFRFSSWIEASVGGIPSSASRITTKKSSDGLGCWQAAIASREPDGAVAVAQWIVSRDNILHRAPGSGLEQELECLGYGVFYARREQVLTAF